MRSDNAGQTLGWLIAMGADEIILEQPINRFVQPMPEAPVGMGVKTAVQLGAGLACPQARPIEACLTIGELEEALSALDDHPLKRTASHLCFTGGHEQGQLMVIGDVAGRDEDLSGKPFAGAAAALLGNMLAAIGFSPETAERQKAVSLFNLVPWRPPGNRPPSEVEVAACLPFLVRAIEIIQPRAILCFGSLPLQSLLGRREGITSLRGRWFDYPSKTGRIPMLGTFGPRLLLQQKAQKRLVWRDLLSIEQRLREA